jgi:hypothetical protein
VPPGEGPGPRRWPLWRPRSRPWTGAAWPRLNEPARRPRPPPHAHRRCARSSGWPSIVGNATGKPCESSRPTGG